MTAPRAAFLAFFFALPLAVVAPAQQGSTPAAHSESRPQEPATKAGKAARLDVQRRTREQLGLEFAILSSKIRRSIIRTDTAYGFAVAKVAPKSLAAAAGIGRGTIVLEVDGVPLREVAELEAVLAKAKPGAKIELLCSQRKKVRRLFDRKPWVQRKLEIELPGAAAGDAKPPAPQEPKEKKKKEKPLTRDGGRRAV